MKRFFLFFALFPLLLFASPIKAVIFDCDGTLADTEELHIEAWRKTLRTYNYEFSDAFWLKHCIGRSGIFIANFFAEQVGTESAQTLYARKEHYFTQLHTQGITPISPTVAFAKELAANKEKYGIKIGVASAAAKNSLLRSLNHLKIFSLFDVVLSGHDDLHEYGSPERVNKPKPFVYLHAAKKLGVNPSECLVIEDSMTGVESSTQAGCLTVVIPNKYTQGQDLSKAHVQLESLEGMTFDHLLQVALFSH